MLDFFEKYNIDHFVLSLFLFGVLPLAPIVSKLLCHATILESDAYLTIAMYSFLVAFTSSHGWSFGLTITVAVITSFVYAVLEYEEFTKSSYSLYLFFGVFTTFTIERFIKHCMKGEPCFKLF